MVGAEKILERLGFLKPMHGLSTVLLTKFFTPGGSQGAIVAYGRGHKGSDLRCDVKGLTIGRALSHNGNCRRLGLVIITSLRLEHGGRILF